MAILAPCLFMAAVGLVFGAIHLLSRKDGDSDDARFFSCSGLGCGSCANRCDRAGDARKDA